MQTVIVHPADVKEAHSAMLPYLEDSDKFTLVPVINDELQEPTVLTATGSHAAVSAFLCGLSVYSRFPNLEDPNLVDMRDMGDRLRDLLPQAEQYEDGTCRAVVTVTP